MKHLRFASLWWLVSFIFVPGLYGYVLWWTWIVCLFRICEFNFYNIWDFWKLRMYRFGFKMSDF